MRTQAVTFVLPGDNRSGGVRVTALMGNVLLQRGYRVRIAHPDSGISLQNLSVAFRRLAGRKVPTGCEGWLHVFKGPRERYRDINDLSFEPGEVVIAVGTYVVQEVNRLCAPRVIKVRFNHGLPAQMTDEYRDAWSLPMRTITVSKTLVPQLEELSGQPVLAVVPNGIDRTEYYPEPGIARVAVGTIYSTHANKAPQDIIRLVNRVGEVFPEVPRTVFSTDPRPPEIKNCLYERFPPIPRARQLYSSSLVWLLASYTEGLPGSVLEAMACGAVVISTDNAGSLEVISDGVNGIIVRKSDFNAFIDKIRLVLSDDTLRRHLAQGGFETVKRFTWESAADRMAEFLSMCRESKCDSEMSIR